MPAGSLLSSNESCLLVCVPVTTAYLNRPAPSFHLSLSLFPFLAPFLPSSLPLFLSLFFLCSLPPFLLPSLPRSLPLFFPPSSLPLSVFACLGFLSPASRGSLTTAVLVAYVFMGSVAGYISARLYKSKLPPSLLPSLSPCPELWIALVSMLATCTCTPLFISAIYYENMVSFPCLIPMSHSLWWIPIPVLQCTTCFSPCSDGRPPLEGQCANVCPLCAGHCLYCFLHAQSLSLGGWIVCGHSLHHPPCPPGALVRHLSPPHLLWGLPWLQKGSESCHVSWQL